MAVQPRPRLEGSYRMTRDRRIGFAEYGRAEGRPVFWFHGTPGGRRQIAPSARIAAERMDIRLVVLERPGIGESTPHLYENIAASASDVLAIADRLGIDRFAFVGLSGGGPYGLAVASRAPDRVIAGAVLGGVAPAVGPEAIGGGVVGLLRRVAPLLEVSHGAIGRTLHPMVRALLPVRSQIFDAYIAMSPEGDQRVFRRPENKAMFLDDIVSATWTQVRAPVLDAVLFTRDWGFSVRDIRVPIRLWHGDADNIVPLAHGRHLAAMISDSELRVRAGESHLGALDAAEEVFGVLLALWPGPQASTA